MILRTRLGALRIPDWFINVALWLLAPAFGPVVWAVMPLRALTVGAANRRRARDLSNAGRLRRIVLESVHDATRLGVSRTGGFGDGWRS